MSEKTLWQWVNNKMSGNCGWDSERIENCSTKGIPDTVVTVEARGVRVSTFIELKDWSESTKHPLTLEQHQFLKTFGGVVLIRTSQKEMSLCMPDERLMSCDVKWAKANGRNINRSKFSPEQFAKQVLDSYGEWLCLNLSVVDNP